MSDGCNGNIIFSQFVSLTAICWVCLFPDLLGVVRELHLPLYDIMGRSSIVYYHLVNQHYSFIGEQSCSQHS